ncbi:SRPBCC family protein [Catenuloplanes atrovinosus]|uniref:Uncharacterized protein YndB with AHSA1/START domain n=1 Tax=Catenuloplanes atrovinosus TaxID=137266 RepID=A0AAE3YMF6_9ACTN|nr:SRPBCC domain-containing protein [Catenuloplanes atrovinosus]MDR7276454.1 uncharacterized protein YndB with AHSA1/START domain [Catenuloplanes atrovinosus]
MATSGDETTAVRGTFGFNAPAEVVFGVLTDPDRATRWLPVGVTAEPAPGGRLLVRGGGHRAEYDVDIDPDRLEVRWRPATGTGPHGSARVGDAPAGGSEVSAEVRAPLDEDRLRRLLGETVTHLRRDVEDNFNAG